LCPFNRNEAVRKYAKNVYRVLTAISVMVALLVFVTGKTELTEYVKIFRSYFTMSEIDNAETNYIFLEGTDNLLTTIVKTFFVILAIVFLTIGSILSGILETIIWAVSFGTYKFYCTRENGICSGLGLSVIGTGCLVRVCICGSLTFYIADSLERTLLTEKDQFTGKTQNIEKIDNQPLKLVVVAHGQNSRRS
jgi:hypothetical protein